MSVQLHHQDKPQVQVQVRRRAAHKKSGTGCDTCKARHLRCDERHPTCERCEKAGRQCSGYDNRQLQRRFQFKAFKAVSFDKPVDTPDHLALKHVDRGLSAFTSPPINSVESSALEFFGLHTVPLLSRFSYSSLWSGQTLHFIHSTPVLRQIALAVGAQHRCLTDSSPDVPGSPLSITSGTSSTTTSDINAIAAADAYSGALRALRHVLVENKSSATIVALACLLLALHDSLSRRRDDFHVHLYNGLRLIGERNDIDRADIGPELRTTLRRLGLNSLLVKPRLEVLKVLRDSRDPIADARAMSDQVHSLDTIRSMIDDVATSCFDFVARVTWGMFTGEAATSDMRDDLSARLAAATADLAAWDAAHPTHTGCALFMRPIIEARAILSSIFLQAVATRYQTTYDKYIRSFRQIVALMRRALGAMHSAHESAAQLFSLDLGIVSTLSYTASQCRDPAVRREAVDLIMMAPSRDGAWDTHSTAAGARQKIELEERLADNWDEEGRCVYVPEECRVHFTSILEPCAENGFRRQMVVQLKPTAWSNETESLCFDIT